LTVVEPRRSHLISTKPLRSRRAFVQLPSRDLHPGLLWFGYVTRKRVAVTHIFLFAYFRLRLNILQVLDRLHLK